MSSIAFGLLAVVLLPLWFVAGVVLACFKSTRTAGLILLSTAVALPVVAFFAVFSFRTIRTEAPATAVVSVSAKSPARNPAPALPLPALPAPLPDENNLPPTTSKEQKGLIDKFSAEAAQLVNKWSRIFAESMAAERKQNDTAALAPGDSPGASATPSTPTLAPGDSPGAKDRPDWVGKTPRTEGDVYQTCVTVGPFVDRQECEENKLKELRKAFDDYVAICLGSKWAGKIRLPDKDLLALVAEEYEETAPSHLLGQMMTSLHLLVRFDRKVTDQVEGARRQWIVQAHLRQAGAGLAGLWLGLGVLWSYLRLDQHSDGRYRGRLRLAAGAFLCAVAAAVWWTVQG